MFLGWVLHVQFLTFKQLHSESSDLGYFWTMQYITVIEMKQIRFTWQIALEEVNKNRQKSRVSRGFPRPTVFGQEQYCLS